MRGCERVHCGQGERAAAGIQAGTSTHRFGARWATTLHVSTYAPQQVTAKTRVLPTFWPCCCCCCFQCFPSSTPLRSCFSGLSGADLSMRRFNRLSSADAVSKPCIRRVHHSVRRSRQGCLDIKRSPPTQASASSAENSQVSPGTEACANSHALKLKHELHTPHPQLTLLWARNLAPSPRLRAQEAQTIQLGMPRLRRLLRHSLCLHAAPTSGGATHPWCGGTHRFGRGFSNSSSAAAPVSSRASSADIPSHPATCSAMGPSGWVYMHEQRAAGCIHELSHAIRTYHAERVVRRCDLLLTVVPHDAC